MRIGPVDGLLVLGGGLIFRKLIDWCHAEELEVRALVAPRHASEEAGGETLSSFLRRKNVRHVIAESLQDTGVAPLLEGTQNFFRVSLGAAWIFRQHEIESLFFGSLFNLHGTGLPRDRGGGGGSWQILMGKRFGFCTLHLVDSGVDTGPVVARQEFLFPSSARIPAEFHEAYDKRALQFLTDFVERCRSSEQELELEKQPEFLSTYWPRLSTSLNGFVDWRLTAPNLERFICAFDDPYAGAKTFWKNQLVAIKSVSVSSQEESFHPFQYGLVFRAGPRWICVAVDGGTLVVERMLDEGGTNIVDSVGVGDRLTTPDEKLMSARQRVFYGTG